MRGFQHVYYREICSLRLKQLLDAGASGGKRMADIIDTAKQLGQFNILLKALEMADLTETLRGNGPFTVFAPTDDAFVMLPQGVFQALLNDISKLRQILLSHVVSGEHYADDLTAAEYIKNIQNEKLSIKIAKEPVIENAVIIQSDIECDNGIIHAIDAVIAPKIPSKTHPKAT